VDRLLGDPGTSAKRGGRGKEMLTEEIPQPLSTTCEMDSEEMGVGLIGKGLRNEPDEEANDLIIINGGESGGTEVDEEALGEHCGPMPTTPPFINKQDGRVIAVLLYMTNDHLGCSLFQYRQHAQVVNQATATARISSYLHLRPDASLKDLLGHHARIHEQ
jgi:hypothetical protein